MPGEGSLSYNNDCLISQMGVLLAEWGAKDPQPSAVPPMGELSEWGRVVAAKWSIPPPGMAPYKEERTCFMRAEDGPLRNEDKRANLGGILNDSTVPAVEGEGREAQPP